MMDLTECIRSKIEKIRQAKLNRHLAQTDAIEARIAARTSRRSDLFRRLEDELNKLITAPLGNTSSISGDGSHTQRPSAADNAAKFRLTSQRPSSAHEASPDDSDHGAEKAYDDDDFDQADEQEHVDQSSVDDRYNDSHQEPRKLTKESFLAPIRSEARGGVETTSTVTVQATDVASSETLANLRLEAEETDEMLQADRLLLSTLRAAHARDVARLERLEADTCKHSELWEAEEQARLSMHVDMKNSRSSKRSRDAEEILPNRGALKRARLQRAVETLAVIGVGIALASAKQTYF